jgi:hypothetical protein
MKTDPKKKKQEDELFHEQAGNNNTGYEGEKEKDGTLPATEKGRITNSGDEHGLDDMLHGEKEEEEEL